MDPRNQDRKQYRIDAAAYAKLGAARIKERGGFVLGLAEGECQGETIPFTPRQWGAWRAYFKARGIKTTFMDAKAKATAENKLAKNPHCWTVPAEWPHEFDSEATVQGDHEAGNLFMRNWRPPNPVYADAAQRAITATKYKRWSERMPKADTLPLLQLEDEKPSLIDKDQLLRDYEKDMAAERARRAPQTEAA